MQLTSIKNVKYFIKDNHLNLYRDLELTPHLPLDSRFRYYQDFQWYLDDRNFIICEFFPFKLSVTINGELNIYEKI